MRLNNIVSPDILEEIYLLNLKYVNKKGLAKTVLEKRNKIHSQIKNDAKNHSIDNSVNIEYSLETPTTQRKIIELEIKRLTNAYNYASKHLNCGELDVDFLEKLNSIVEPNAYGERGNSKYRIRANGDVAKLTGTPGQRYIPPDTDIRWRLTEMCNFLNEHKFFFENKHFMKKENLNKMSILQDLNLHEKLTAVEKALLAHFHIVTIHPFFDGNGRVARAVQDTILNKNLLFPATVKASEKTFYKKLLKQAQINYTDRTSNSKYWQKLKYEENPFNMKLRHYTNIQETEKNFFDYLASKIVNELYIAIKN
ncbi:MAG: Fic family protein [Candidatus Woesearchaeota archaeon]